LLLFGADDTVLVPTTAVGAFRAFSSSRSAYVNKSSVTTSLTWKQAGYHLYTCTPYTLTEEPVKIVAEAIYRPDAPPIIQSPTSKLERKGHVIWSMFSLIS